MNGRREIRLIFLSAALLCGACGTRVDSPAALDASPDAASATTLPPSQLTDGAVSAQAPETGPAPADTPGPQQAAAGAAPRSDRTAGQRPETSAAAKDPAATQGDVPTGRSEQAPSGRSQPEGAPAPSAPAVGARSPLVVASVGTYSGPIGSAFAPMLRAVQAWVSSVNSRGGLNGHKVELITYDDGADPARSRAQVQDAVERRRVIAFVQNSQAVSGQSSVEYIVSKRIPVIGTDTGTTWVYDHPMFFPQTSSTGPLIAATMYTAAQQALPEGKSKIGWLTCVESTACNEAVEKVFTPLAPKLGFQVVYQGRASLGQPDFTAECLAARNAGAQVVLNMMDGNSVRRYAASCSRQGYEPVIGVVSQVADNSMKDTPSLDGMIAPSVLVPWFSPATPALAEYKQTISTFAKGTQPGLASLAGWASAKLFEKAAASVSEPPTTADILNGLWSIRDDDLGGLTQPLTFEKDKPAVPRTCFWNIRIKDGAWISTGDKQRQCVGSGAR